MAAVIEWPEETVATLIALWVGGNKTRKIAQRLGITNNAVCGKVNRLVTRGVLTARGSPIKRDPGAAPKEMVVKPAPKLPTLPSLEVKPEPPSPPLPPLPPAPVLVEAPKPVIVAPPQIEMPKFQRPPRTCAWPIGHPRDKGFRMCEAPVDGKGPYCPKCAAKAYVRVRPRAVTEDQAAAW